jgi:methionyl-tRNA formyltransferase
MNAEDVSNQLSKIGSEIISDCLDLIEIGKAKFVEQDHNKATYAQKIDKEEAKIKWDEDAIKIIAKSMVYIQIRERGFCSRAKDIKY